MGAVGDAAELDSGDGGVPFADADLLRFATIGSVDDGKSTLIGRLLHDAKGLLRDQIEAVAASSAKRGHAGLDLSLVTDGLRAEREQGITIDVAYRYFATPRRSFIVGDNPGHAQYTRNMATGASTAEVAVVLVDAQHGLTTQTRRHVTVASLLGIRQFALCVNKMDLVDWSEEAFDAVVAEFLGTAERLAVESVTPIPISALLGDNVVERSESTLWYTGPTLLEYLETVAPEPVGAGTGPRLPVQLVLREPGRGRPTRLYAGMLHGGELRAGSEVTVLPSGQRAHVARIRIGSRDVEGADPERSVTVELTEDVDVVRGDVIAAGRLPAVSRELEATLCWFSEKELSGGQRILVKQGTRVERAVVREVVSRLDVELLDHEESVESLALNDIGVVRLLAAGPLVLDSYQVDRTLGSFVVIDEQTERTVGAGMITVPTAAPTPSPTPTPRSGPLIFSRTADNQEPERRGWRSQNAGVGGARTRRGQPGRVGSTSSTYPTPSTQRGDCSRSGGLGTGAGAGRGAGLCTS